MSIALVGDHRARIGDHLGAAGDDLLGARRVEVGHHRNLDAAAGAAANLFLVAREHGKGAAADGADAKQADLNRFHHECRFL